MDTINWWFLLAGVALLLGLFLVFVRSRPKQDDGHLHGVDFGRHKGKENERR